MRIDTVVFDLFHTLVNPEEFLADSHRRAERIAEALELDPVEFAGYWRESCPARNSARHPSVTERVLEHCARIGSPRDPGSVESALDHAGIPDDRALARPAASVMETLRVLRERGYRLGVLSNCDAYEARGWDRSPLASIVDAAALSCDTGALKPEPEAYAGILRRLGAASPAYAAYVGDGESGELVGARRFGFGRIVLMEGFVRGTNFPGAARLPQARQEADAVVRDLRELLSDPRMAWPK